MSLIYWLRRLRDYPRWSRHVARQRRSLRAMTRTMLGLEALEPRVVLATFVEDFSDPALTAPAFDPAFIHEDASGNTLSVDRIQPMELFGNCSSPPNILTLVGRNPTDRITFNQSLVGSVDFAEVTVAPFSGGTTVTFEGATDTKTVLVPLIFSGPPCQTVSAASTDLGDNGAPLGAITSIVLFSNEGAFDDIRINAGPPSPPPPPSNSPPDAVDDSTVAIPGAPTSIPVLDNDQDPDGDPLTVSAVSAAGNGTVVISGNEILYTPNPGAGGVDTFTYTIDDGRGDSDTATVTVALTVGLIPDPCDPAQQALAVVGTNDSDLIFVSEFGRDTGMYAVALNESFIGLFGPVSRAVIYALDGNDAVFFLGNEPAWIYGGEGNDLLWGSAGHDVLLGGDGNDTLLGWGGRDLLIGGRGVDGLLGGSDEDILIGGLTAYDVPAAQHALCDLMDEWTGGGSYAERIHNLRNGGGRNGSTLLVPATVHDDGASDMLRGAGGTDAYFADLDPGTLDIVFGPTPGEERIDID